jgi:hypothetical protein
MVPLVAAVLASAPVSQEMADQLIAAAVEQELTTGRTDKQRSVTIQIEVQPGVVVNPRALPNDRRFNLVSRAHLEKEARAGRSSDHISVYRVEMSGDRASVGVWSGHFVLERAELFGEGCGGEWTFKKTRLGWEIDRSVKHSGSCS